MVTLRLSHTTVINGGNHDANIWTMHMGNKQPEIYTRPQNNPN